MEKETNKLPFQYLLERLDIINQRLADKTYSLRRRSGEKLASDTDVPTPEKCDFAIALENRVESLESLIDNLLF
jgi:hypothetical protein